jgi:predicted CoA-binding protein
LFFLKKEPKTVALRGFKPSDKTPFYEVERTLFFFSGKEEHGFRINIEYVRNPPRSGATGSGAGPRNGSSLFFLKKEPKTVALRGFKPSDKTPFYEVERTLLLLFWKRRTWL